MSHTRLLLRSLVLRALVVLATSDRLNELLERAEDEVSGEGALGLDELEARIASAFTVGASGSVTAAKWASAMTSVTFAEGGVDDEILPYIQVGASKAELKEAPTAKGMAVLHRKQRYAGLKVEVLENQLVVLSGTESGAERKERLAAGLGDANPLASELAGTAINGTAMFMIAYRQALPGQPHVHEIGFFDGPLWKAFLEYMAHARDSGYTPMRIHWNVLPKEQREPWTITGPSVEVVATPNLLPPSPEIA